MHHLVGTSEAADILGVTRQRVNQLVSRGVFPAPVAVLAAGKVWERKTIEKWARANGYGITEP